MNREEVLRKLDAVKPLLKDRFGVRSIALAGSFARGEATGASDVDIIVDMPSAFHSFFQLKYFLEEKLGRSVDLGLEKNLRTFIRKEIENELIYV